MNRFATTERPGTEDLLTKARKEFLAAIEAIAAHEPNDFPPADEPLLRVLIVDDHRVATDGGVAGTMFGADQSIHFNFTPCLSLRMERCIRCLRIGASRCEPLDPPTNSGGTASAIYSASTALDRLINCQEIQTPQQSVSSAFAFSAASLTMRPKLSED